MHKLIVMCGRSSQQTQKLLGLYVKLMTLLRYNTHSFTILNGIISGVAPTYHFASRIHNTINLKNDSTKQLEYSLHMKV